MFNSNYQGDHPNVLAKPPLIFFVFMGISFFIKKQYPAELWQGPVRSSGIVLVILGFTLVLICARLFLNSGTNVNPFQPVLKIVTSGPYRFSRNPMYLGLAAMYAGISIVWSNPWMLLSVIPLLIVLYFGVILPEEIYLEKKFGNDYLEYKQSVRRWI